MFTVYFKINWFIVNILFFFFTTVGEEKFLKQLHLEEQYGPILRPTDIPDTKLKKNSSAGAAISYNYDEGATSAANETPLPNAIDASHLPATIVTPDAVVDDTGDNANDGNEEDEEEEDDSDIDFGKILWFFILCNFT